VHTSPRGKATTSWVCIYARHRQGADWETWCLKLVCFPIITTPSCGMADANWKSCRESNRRILWFFFLLLLFRFRSTGKSHRSSPKETLSMRCIVLPNKASTCVFLWAPRSAGVADAKLCVCDDGRRNPWCPGFWLPCVGHHRGRIQDWGEEREQGTDFLPWALSADVSTHTGTYTSVYAPYTHTVLRGGEHSSIIFASAIAPHCPATATAPQSQPQSAAASNGPRANQRGPISRNGLWRAAGKFDSFDPTRPPSASTRRPGGMYVPPAAAGLLASLSANGDVCRRDPYLHP